MSSGNSAGAATSLTFSHTVGSGSNRLLVVSVHLRDGVGTPVTGVTYGGNALTAVPSGSANSGTGTPENRTELWSLLDPPTGTADVVISLSASKNIVGGATSFFGVDQTTPLGTAVAAGANSASPSVVVSSAADGLVRDAISTRGDVTALAPLRVRRSNSKTKPARGPPTPVVREAPRPVRHR